MPCAFLHATSAAFSLTVVFFFFFHSSCKVFCCCCLSSCGCSICSAAYCIPLARLFYSFMFLFVFSFFALSCIPLAKSDFLISWLEFLTFLLCFALCFLIFPLLRYLLFFSCFDFFQILTFVLFNYSFYLLFFLLTFPLSRLFLRSHCRASYISAYVLFAFCHIVFFYPFHSGVSFLKFLFSLILLLLYMFLCSISKFFIFTLLYVFVIFVTFLLCTLSCFEFLHCIFFYYSRLRQLNHALICYYYYFHVYLQ